MEFTFLDTKHAVKYNMRYIYMLNLIKKNIFVKFLGMA